MKTNLYKPVRFFTVTYLVSYAFWLAAALVSKQPGGEAKFISLLIPGMMAPFLVALWLLLSSQSRTLWTSFKERLFNLRLIKPVYFFPGLLIIPAAILIATLISVVTGGDPTQFQLAEGFSFSIGMAPTLLVLILAASFEELGWRGYGVDSLAPRKNYFKATLRFGLLWACWHLPLFFITGTYQNEIAVENIWYAVNFVVGIVPLAFIVNWMYRLNRESITAVILLHFFINLAQEALNISQATKCIETGVLTVFAIVIVLTNKSLFFTKSSIEESK